MSHNNHFNENASSAIQARWQQEFLLATQQFNKQDAQLLIDQAFQYYTVEDVCLLLIQPTLYQIGNLWHENKLSWINENFASTLISASLLQKLQTLPPSPHAPKIFMSGVPEETHEIGLIMLALFWKRIGLNVIYNGVAKDTQSLLQDIIHTKPTVVCLSAMTQHRARNIIPISQTLAQFPHPQPILCYGGGAFSQPSPLQQHIRGVYLGANAAIATQQVKILLQRIHKQ